MKVSVVIPYYNDRKYLPQAIESVLNQSFTDFELILINHATTDACREIAHSYNDPRIVHIDMEKNYGAGTALMLQRSLEIAKGKYIKLFCADDIFYKDGLKILVEYMDSHPDKDFAFGNLEYIDINNKSLKQDWFTTRPYFSLSNNEVDCLKLCFKDFGYLPYIGSIIKISSLKSIEKEVSLISYLDAYLWLNLFIKGYKIGYVDKYVAGWRIHKGQMSSTSHYRWLCSLSEFEKMSFIKSFFRFEDIDLFKKVFSESYYVQTIDDINKEDMKFIVAYELMLSHIRQYQYVGYNYIYELLNDDNKRKYLEEKFNFSVAEFRKIYTTLLNDGLGLVPIRFLIIHVVKKLIQFITFPQLRCRKPKQRNV